MKRFILTILTVSIASLSLNAQNNEITGSIKDSDGKAISQVVISDGYNTTQSDQDGQYTLATSEKSRFIFISTPSGYISSVKNNEKETCFYQKLTNDKSVYNFSLKKNPQNDKDHNIIVIADPQILDMEDKCLMDERMKTMIPDITKAKEKYTFGLCLGDIVGYDHSLYPEYQKSIDKLGLDFRHVQGNHDMTRIGVRTHEGSMKKYEDFFGPAWYSFNVGDVHYIVMNNNFFIGRDWYYIGYLDETQMNWLEKDLSYVSKDKKVVVCLHIPTTLSQKDRERFSYSDLSEIQANKNPLYSILDPYDALILSGHMHTCTTQNINDHLTEINVGGLCGAWWCGDICIDGGPAGYKVMNMRGTQSEWTYIGCGYPQDYQMKVYTDDSRFPEQVIVNVWDYDDKWTVEYFENGKKVCDMERFSTQDPYAIELFSDPSKYKISWVGASVNDRFFKAKLSDKAKKIEIKVTDRFGRQYSKKLKIKR